MWFRQVHLLLQMLSRFRRQSGTLCLLSASFVLVISSTWATALILDKASPRNPSEEIPARSAADLILLVECLKKASLTSFLSIPQPLSVILINEIPPSFISTVMAVAPASMAFSTSSFTTDEGLSTTSPAAILIYSIFVQKIYIAIAYHLFFILSCNPE